MAEIRDFFILPDPGCPRDPKVGSHTDYVVSWDTVGGIQACVCLQGPPKAGSGVAKNRCTRRRARLVGQIWLENGEFFPRRAVAGSKVPQGPHGRVP